LGDFDHFLTPNLYRFWELAIKTASPSSQRHFVEAFTAFLNSLVDQAEDRDNDTIRTVDEYLKTRRENIGARPSYAPAELGLDLPDEAFYHPVIVELSYHIADLILLDNVRILLKLGGCGRSNTLNRTLPPITKNRLLGMIGTIS
jgi:hypothetical protein